MKTKVTFDTGFNIEELSLTQIKLMESALKEQVKNVVADAKANLQQAGKVNTGSLLKAITSKVKANENSLYAIVGIDNKYVTYNDRGEKVRPAKYAPLIEFGTKNIEPTFFLTNAANKNKNAILKALKDAAAKAL